MTEVRIKAIEIFYSYAHKDERLRNELDKHLFNMKKQGLITSWYDRNISAGTEWEHEINAHLNSAQIILLLISPDFLASEYCYSIEMTRALERHEAREARVIPVLMQPVDWQGAPFKKLQALPKNAKPVTRWRNRADAFLDITKGIREAVKELARPPAIFIDTATRLLSSSQNSANGTPAPDPVWNVPFRRNPYFTGRDEVIALLRTKLIASKAPLPLVIRGLGGVGKTQTATEYAYRHRNDYQHVLWVRADTADLVMADFVDIATSLNLPIKNEKDQRLVVTIVKRWFQTHHGWLLIFDNADNLETVRDFLPIGEQGHILLTTRTPAPGTEVYETAKPLLRRSLVIFEKTFGLDAINVTDILDVYAHVLRATKHNKEAAQLEIRAKTIKDKYAQENGIESDNEENSNADLMNNNRELFYHKFES